ncbi:MULTISPECIES: cyclopropane-fatty-acyl-phospholipid synthase family protein [unclassified Janthinobacterium]|uniref:SAM-dependent methyltransferase n=1 Tax=unclassified Janthinobacterium TaxID=2610881 RepID=UPI00160DEFDA|nr:MULTISPECIES: cyclopropane-fatty-acyl-phospholipid synthase family protein [unclassified Janthinobacterium]MBB5608448.1 cyclopropane-fatty-acyl-phospholipid synthase [Janthinobacterium sp. S3T4]MBB5613586.1 cyclopropane-fatty-acyl-phospholipid synthase [Janthinobacterium sp. S3M3]
MNTESLANGLHARSGAAYEHLDLSAPARMILSLLDKLKFGALRLRTPDGNVLVYGDGSAPIHLDLHNWNMCAAVLRSGDIGFAETFIAGDWRTDNLPGLIELMIRNRAQIESLIYGSWWGNLLYRLRHLLHRNSRAGSKKNIHAHYDIGNAFYQLWLDPSMTYSSALFSEGDSLEQAQLAKYRRIAGQLQLQPGATVLEIGCGWGGFAETAAREHGAHVTGLTLSTEQLAYARQRLQATGLAEQADLQLCDYRDSAGQYDAIASIEMFEAVGQSYWPGYFECVARNLKPGGRACIQTIVIADELFERYSKSTDFIQQYIFPGGMLPSPTEFRRAAEAQGLRVVDAFSFGLDYAETLRQWRATFLAQRVALEKQGFDGRFLLTWEFYLAYCEAAFQAHNTDVMQFTLLKG